MIYIDRSRLFASSFCAYYIIECIFTVDDATATCGARTNLPRDLTRWLLVDQTRPDCPPRYSDPDFDNYKGVPMTPLHSFTHLSHSAWQERQQVNSVHFVSLFLVLISGTSTETSTKTATRRASAKPKDGRLSPLSSCMRICSHPSRLLADGKEKKRTPSAYNLFVKEHMKTYLADNPGKTNKDAMKHVCLSISFIIIAAHQHA